jgi:hypothetical protein
LDDFWDNALTTEKYTGVEFDSIGKGEDKDEDSSSAGAAEAANKHQNEHHQLGNSFLESDSCVNVEHISVHLLSHLGHDWCNSMSIASGGSDNLPTQCVGSVCLRHQKDVY